MVRANHRKFNNNNHREIAGLSHRWFSSYSMTGSMVTPSGNVVRMVTMVTLLLLLGSSIQAATNSSKIADFDRAIQGLAFKAFKHPKTGVVVQVNVPSQVQPGIADVLAVRLRSGSLKRRGFLFNNEFNIPEGSTVVNRPPLRVVLVYRKFTTDLYSPEGFTIVSPVVGIRVYDAFNLSTDKALPELEFRSTGPSNITVQVPVSTSALRGVVPLCATFDVDGNMGLSNLSSAPNFCSARRLSDFALVVPTGSLPPAPAPAPFQSVPPPPGSPSPRKRKSRRWKVVLGAVLGSIAAVLLVVGVVAAVAAVVRRRRISNMERKADRGEVLHSSVVRSSRAPTAGATRTKPVLEGDYAA